MSASGELLPSVEIEPDATATAAVIWMHGLGADGHDFEPIVPHLGIPPALGVRFVFPHAPAMPITLNMGFVMPAWYDVASLELGSRADEAGLRRSAARITDLIARERERGVAANRIILAGFSQGGALALHVALRHPERLAGLVALSTYLATGTTLAAEAAAANRTIPVFQAHGRHDPMVTYELGVAARDALKRAGYAVEFHEYPMQHEVHPREIADIGAFIRRCLDADE